MLLKWLWFSLNGTAITQYVKLHLTKTCLHGMVLTRAGLQHLC